MIHEERALSRERLQVHPLPPWQDLMALSLDLALVCEVAVSAFEALVGARVARPDAPYAPRLNLPRPRRA